MGYVFCLSWTAGRKELMRSNLTPPKSLKDYAGGGDVAQKSLQYHYIQCILLKFVYTH